MKNAYLILTIFSLVNIRQLSAEETTSKNKQDISKTKFSDERFPEYKKPSDEIFPEYKKPSAESFPEYKKPSDESFPEYKKPSDENFPEYKKPSDESFPEYKKPSDESFPEYKKPSDENFPEYKKPSLTKDFSNCTKDLADEISCPEGVYKFVGGKTADKIKSSLKRDSKELQGKPLPYDYLGDHIRRNSIGK